MRKLMNYWKTNKGPNVNAFWLHSYEWSGISTAALSDQYQNSLQEKNSFHKRQLFSLKNLLQSCYSKLTGDIGERQCNLFRSGQGKRDKLMLIQVISSCKYLTHYFLILFKSIYMVSIRHPFRTSILERQNIFNNSITKKITTQKIHRTMCDCDHFQKIKKIFIWFTCLMVSLNWPVVFLA